MQTISRGKNHASVPGKNSVSFLKISAVVSIGSIMGLRCTLMFPVQNMEECTAKKSATEIAHSCVCREQAVIPALNRASAYRLLQSIDNSSRKEGGEEGGSKKKVC